MASSDDPCYGYLIVLGPKDQNISSLLGSPSPSPASGPPRHQMDGAKSPTSSSTLGSSRNIVIPSIEECNAVFILRKNSAKIRNDKTEVFRIGRKSDNGSNDFIVRGRYALSQKSDQTTGSIPRNAFELHCHKATGKIELRAIERVRATSGPNVDPPTSPGHNASSHVTTAPLMLYLPSQGEWVEVTPSGAFATLRTLRHVLGKEVRASPIPDGSMIAIGGVGMMLIYGSRNAASSRFLPWYHHVPLSLAAFPAARGIDYIAPWVYPTCGHCIRYNGSEDVPRPICPLCNTKGSPVTRLKLPECSGDAVFPVELYLDPEVPHTHVMNPCGHSVSQLCARWWSTIAMPASSDVTRGPWAHIGAEHRRVCFVCGVVLNCLSPYSRLRFS